MSITATGSNLNASASGGPLARSGLSFQYSLFSGIPVAFVIAAVVLYVVGWSYLYGYYRAFGLSLTELALDTRETMMYASRALAPWLYLGIGIGCALSFIAWLKEHWVGSTGIRKTGSAHHETTQPSRYQERAILNRFLSISLVCFVLLVLQGIVLASVHHGSVDAACAMREDCTDLPPVRLIVDRSRLTPQLFTRLSADNSLEGYVLLVRGKSGYYLFRPIGSRPHSPLGSGPSNIMVAFIPDQVVLAAEVTPGIKEDR